MRKMTVAVVLTGVLSGLLPGAGMSEVPVYPADFEIVALAGGAAPWTSYLGVVIDTTGVGSWCRVDEADRGSGTCTATGSVTLSVAGRNAVWSAIQDQGYFGLAPTHFDPGVGDGSFVELRVTGGGATHVVRTQNTAVAGVDSVVVALNAALPDSVQLSYNEIMP
jgi:hypothetical protein